MEVVKTFLEMVRDYQWWDGSIVICDWGCTEMSCINLSNKDYSVYRYDGNFVGDSENDDEPPDEAWYIEADTFAEWLLMPNCNEQATEPADEREPEQPGWLASLGNITSRPRYPFSVVARWMNRMQHLRMH